MKRLVIYHGGSCFDGFCSAWLFKQAYPDAEFVAAQHGDAPPDVAGRRVVVVDFSYKLDAMLKMAREAESLTVLDHHKTAVEELAGLHIACAKCPPFVNLTVGKSGGRLAWEYLYGNMELPAEWLSTGRSGYSLGVAPWLVDYTEDRDLWRWQLPQSREINAALRSYPMDFVEWDCLNSRSPASLITEGVALLRAESQTVATHVRNAAEIEMDGHKVLAVNATTLISEVAGELAAGRPFGACYFDRADGLRVWSLRERDSGVDVSEIARRRGGGGHKSAAGFQEPIPVREAA